MSYVPRIRRLLPLLVPLLPGLTACSDADTAPPLVLRIDSAGIEVVEHPPDVLSRIPAWTLSEAPRLEIGMVEGPDAYRFHRISGAAVLSRDTVAVLNGGTQELRFYDGDGELIRSVGGEGEGPGEFSFPFGVWEVGDSLAVADARLRRLSLFDRSGDFGRQATPERPGLNPRVLGVFRDGSFVVQDSWFEEITDELKPMYLRLARFGPTGELLDTLPRHRMGLMGRLGDSGLVGGPLFGARTFTAAGPGTYWVGPAGEPEVLRFDPSGRLVQLVRWPDEDRAVSGDDVDRYWGERLEGTEGDRRRQIEILRRSMPVAERFPVFDRLHATRDGGLWIRRYKPFDTPGPREWLVLDETGRGVATVEIPENIRILEIGGDHVAAVRTDELDVEHFTVYDLVEEGEAGG